MTNSQLAADFTPTCRTVVVAVKLDSESKELLTWALVKVAQPGDCVIALHVLSTNEVVDQDGKSSLLSLFKTFDSVLAVYEGFCNLKQVDLKLKICRGSSIRKILVREAKSYFASEIILGTARNHHTIRSSTSTAKYCAKKLHKDCSIVAVNNGKIVFCRESSTGSNLWANGTEDYHRNGLFGAIQRKLSKNSSILKDSNGSSKANKIIFQKLDLANSGSELKKNCSICSPKSICADDTCTNDDDVDNSLALVPVQQPKSSNPLSSLIKEMTESRPGWPLLRQSILSNRKASVQKISVVEWAMRLPDRRILQITNSDCLENQSCKLDAESGALVLVGSETESTRSYNSVSLPKELEGLHEKYASTCRLFKYQELVSATSNFKQENMIGKGGSSQVYRGCLPENKEVAVKILNSSEDVLKEFVLEIEIITTLNHKNIISLFGFCFEDNNLLLVYDFLSRGSLEENLQGNKKDLFAFGWSERFKVAFGVAEALQYLHNISEQPVIHRDVKSSNILLSDDFEPQLSDFGLATWASTTSSHITCTDVAGTFGYLAPEYFMYGKVNDKIDVYAFGVVLLELLSGRKPISNEYPKGQESLVMWAKPILNGGKITQLLDPSLGNDYDNDQMESMILAATLSIRRSPRARPSMNLVLKILQGDLETIKWARLEVNSSDGVHGTIKVNPSDGCDPLDDEELSPSNLQSHLNIVFKDMDDSSLSMSSIDQSVSLEDYLQGRWSRSSSFD